ncbi:MAG: hypothetical protein WAJ88_10690, partial [Pseudolabrys sp.]
ITAVSTNNVMAGRSRSKNGVLSHAYFPAIHVFELARSFKTWMPATSAGMTMQSERILHWRIKKTAPRNPEPLLYYRRVYFNRLAAS